MQWYTLQVHSGSEFAVQEQVKRMMESEELSGQIGDLLVPYDEVSEYKKGEEIIKKVPVYKAYAFIQCELSTPLQLKIQGLPKVGKFVSGIGKQPVELSEKDIEKILEKDGEVKRIKKINFEEGDMVRINEGSFANFNGAVQNFDEHSGQLKINVKVFGRETPVEIHYSHVSEMEE